MAEKSSSQSERVVRAVFTLTMAESLDSETLVAVDPLEVAHLSGAPLEVVNGSGLLPDGSRELLATVEWPDGSRSAGHFVHMMEEAPR